MHAIFKMMASKLIAAAVSAAAVAAMQSSDPANDLITSLPGWTGNLPTPQYSGYLALANGKQMHYHLVVSEASPSEDPLVIWLNGGPGCSSYIGFWLENGPFTMNGDGTIDENPGRWNQVANVLFLESPVGVGFSYWPGQALPYSADDNTTAQDNLNTLIAFLTAFPEYQGRPLWISGESYAGVYVPMFAQAILAYPEAKAAGINLKGILVGNGAVATGDWYEGGLVQQRMQHAYDHGLFSTALKTSIDAACTNWVNRSDDCNNLLNTMADQMGPLNTYNIEVTCGSSVAVGVDGSTSTSKAKGAAFVDWHRRALLTGRMDPFGWFDVGADPCSAAEDALTSYLNQSDVVDALHVGAGVAAMGGWSECAGGTLAYTRIPQDERVTVYPGLLQSIAVLIFNGDQDECIPYIQDAAWTAAMGYNTTASGAWRPWVQDNQVAGYVTEYAAPVRFTFATVKRAGHEVPMYQPLRALAMLERYINGQRL